MVVLGGSSVATMLPIIFSPLLTRMYDVAEDFAPYTLYISFTYVLGSIANSQYTSAIMIADNDEESIGLFRLSSLLNLFFFFASLTILFFFRAPLLTFLNAPIVFDFIIWIIPLTVLLTGLYANLLQWSYRFAQFQRVAKSRMLQALTTVLFQIIFGIFFKNLQGLILGYFLGQFISVLVLWYLNFKGESIRFLFLFRQLKLVSTKYSNFLKFQTSSDLVNVFTQQMPSFFWSKYALPAELGWYGFAFRILVAPSSIVTGAIGDVFRQNASKEFNSNGNAIRSFKLTSKLLFGIMFLPSLLIFVLGPWIFKVIFGHSWDGAGRYSQIMMIMFFPKFIVSPLSYMYIIARKQKEDFYLHILILLTTCISLFAGFFYFNSATSALFLFSVNYCLIYVIYFIRSLKFARGE